MRGAVCCHQDQPCSHAADKGSGHVCFQCLVTACDEVPRSDAALTSSGCALGGLCQSGSSHIPLPKLFLNDFDYLPFIFLVFSF